MPDTHGQRRKQFIFAGLILAQLVLISLQVPLGEEPSYFEKGIFFLFSPVQKSVSAVLQKVGSAWKRHIYLRNVERQNQDMRDELFLLRQENIQLRAGLDKLRQKQETERILADLKHSFLFATVIGVDASDRYKSVTIDKGSRDGIQSGMAVVDSRGFLVGRTVNPVSPAAATVQLLTDDNSGVSVYSSAHRVIGVLAGDGKSGTCWLKYVRATNIDLAVGEDLVTSGYDKVYPAGLKAGRVVSIGTDSTLFKKVEAQPFLDFGHLDFVAVLTQRMDTRF